MDKAARPVSPHGSTATATGTSNMKTSSDKGFVAASAPTSNVKLMNFYPFNDIETISPRPLLFITGDQAHSKEFSEDAYQRAAEPKELHIVAGAGHVDLYDRVNLIPWDKLTAFFGKHLIQASA
jgi:fermentation-respiration switch protein FrsA (DUF1100 family)